MLKILAAQQIKELDANTVRHEPIASIDLMERACQAFVQWLVERFDASKKIGIICGTGNNGGDGLGIARLLDDWSYPVKVCIVRGTAKETGDFKINLDRIGEKIKLYNFEDSARDFFKDCDILIDAVFGSGLSRSSEGIYAEVIQSINECRAIRIAVDIPSGLFADQHSTGAIVQADHTVSFQLPKLAFMFPENYRYVGEWHVVDIGLSKGFIKSAETPFFYLTKKSVKKIVRPRSTFDHKGDHGRGMLIAGSFGKMGACILAARAALRGGIGLLTVHVPRVGYPILQSAVPEAMVSVDNHDEFFTGNGSLDGFDVIGIGPGLGQAGETVVAFGKILACGKPMVIDADALNILSVHRELLSNIPAGSMLTPHPKEFERLVGKWKDDFDRLNKLMQFASDIKCVVILKGAHTSIATPEGKVYFNSTGNPGMASGGSGDVLTGILTGLLAQGYSAIESAMLGVYLHGLSGDIAARDKGMNSLIASDIIDYLPLAFKDLIRLQI